MNKYIDILSEDLGSSEMDLVYLAIEEEKKRIKAIINNNELDNLRTDVARELEASGIKTDNLSNKELITAINNQNVYNWADYYIGYYNAYNEIKKLI